MILFFYKKGEIEVSQSKTIEKGIEISWMTWGKMRDSSINLGEVSYVKSDHNKGPERIFNVDFSQDNTEEKIMKMIAYIKAGIMPDSILITPNTKPENLAEILSKKGFDIDDSDPCMLLELDDFSYIDSTIGDFEIFLLDSKELLPQWVEIVNEALFGYELISLEQFRDVFDLDNTFFYLGLLNGTPASVCMTIIDGDTSVLEMVATLEKYRCKGLATTMISQALNDLRSAGIKTISLRAEKDGVRVYQKLGFKICFNRVVASCNWDRVYKEACPCFIEEEKIKKAKELLKDSSDMDVFIRKMNEHKVIGKKLEYDYSNKVIYLTKVFACECGSKCGSNCYTKDSILQRCHCEYVNDLNTRVPMSYCKCSAVFFEPLFKTLFGQETIIEPVETVLSGGESCVFKIIPARYVSKEQIMGLNF